MENRHPAYQLDKHQQELWDAFEGSTVQLLGTDDLALRADALLFHAAQPRYYIRNYRLRWWQGLFSPFSYRRVTKSLKQLKESTVDKQLSARLVEQIDNDLAAIEFGGKRLSVSQRFRVRREILREDISPWKVRSTFVSASVVREDNQVRIHRVAPYVFWPALLTREVLLGLAVALIIRSWWEVVTSGCVTCNSFGLSILALLLTWMAYFSHILGPERRTAERCLANFQLLDCSHQGGSSTKDLHH